MASVSCSVVIITRNRPGILSQSLHRLQHQELPAHEVIVVDSSDQFHAIEGLPRVRHIHFPAGRAQMPRARNEGIRRSSGEVVAFLDDDCLADPGWLSALARSYAQFPEAAGVGGRITDSRWIFDAARPVGRVLADGQVVSNFFGDPGGVVEVDILPGGNMSFRRDWLLNVHGFDPAYVATNHREDPDLCLRIKARGGQLFYNPEAHALHLNARNLLRELSAWHEFYLRYSFSRNEGFFLGRHFPDSVLTRFGQDSWRLFRSALASRSLVATACLPVHFVSFLLGLTCSMLPIRRSLKDGLMA